MIDDHHLSALARKLDPYSDDAIALTGRARGHVLTVAITAMICASATSDEEREIHARELKQAGALYVDYIDRARREAGPGLGDRVMAERHLVRDFARRVEALPADGRIGREEALEIADHARNHVVVALYHIIVEMQRDQMEELDDQIRAMSDRARISERMIKEIERIGRTIKLISINASVEAARAGGEPGRTFKVIAQEVRQLSEQSAGMLADLKGKIATTAEPGAAPPAPPG